MANCPKSDSLITGRKVFTPLGCYLVEACKSGLHHLGLIDVTDKNFNPDLDVDVRVEKATADSKTGQDSQPLELAVVWLQAYFKDPKSLPGLPPVCLPLEKSTEFERAVWTTLASSATFGIKLSYGELAEKIGNPKAARAVGTALKKNPVALVIPCHRIIRSNGQTGNYSGGKNNKVKEWLLEHENQNKIAEGC